MSKHRPDNPFDAMRRVINHEANQDDDGGFIAQLGGIQPEPEDDGPTARELFQHVDFTKPGTPVYAAKPGETYTPRNQPEYFYHGEPRADGTHDVYRIPFRHITNPQLTDANYVGNFTTDQIKNGEHRK